MRLGSAVSRVQAELARGTAEDFSDDARATWLEFHADFVEDLGVEAVRIANRSRADVVSASHVIQALDSVRTNQRSRTAAALNSFGGILAGAGAGQFYAVLSTKDPTALAYALATGSSVIGAVLLTLALVRPA